MDSKEARKLKEGFLVKKVGKLLVNFEDSQTMQHRWKCSDRTVDQVRDFDEQAEMNSSPEGT